jgi:hypothetical protein
MVDTMLPNPKDTKMKSLKLPMHAVEIIISRKGGFHLGIRID